MPSVDFDPFDPDLHADPYPHYARLRADDPVHYVESMGMWVVARYADCVSVSRRPEVFSTQAAIKTLRDPRIPDGVKAVGNPAFTDSRHLLASDPPEHTMLRRMVNRGFTQSVVRSWESRVRQIAVEHVDRFVQNATSGSADFVTDVAAAIPIHVIAEVLGVPADARNDFKRWSLGIVESLKPLETVDFESLAVADRELREFFAEVIADRQSNPADDLVSMLVGRSDAIVGEPLTLEELIEFCAFLLVAGNETTSDTLSNWLNILLERPGSFERLRTDPTLVASSFEEALRFDTPALVFVRGLREASVVGDVELPEGATVALLHGSANRDERQWGADAEDFLVERNPKEHLSFGHGAHLCIGAPLVRMETSIVAQVLFERVARIERTADVVRTASFLRRGCVSLPVTVDAAG